MGRKVLGLDIGITSVGWGIIDIDNATIIDAGVRLFDEADKSNNESRRSFRGIRRLERRRKKRKEDLIDILKRENLLEYNHDINPYEARCKGLRNELTHAELTSTLLHICKKRGSSLEYVDDQEKKAKENSPKKILADNDELIRTGRFVCEIQLERLKDENHVRGIKNNFRSADYKKELTQILNAQNINEKLQDEIIECIFRKRRYDDGPGSFKSQTIYGKIYNDDGTVKVNMIEKMTGKCSVFQNELRAPKKAPSAEFFNLLNDLNNLRIEDESIDIEKKQELIQIAFKKGAITLTEIERILNTAISEISGFRLDEKQKPLITKLEGFKDLKNILENYGHSNLIIDFQLLDNITVILTKTKSKEERIHELKKLNIPSEEIIEELSELTKYTGYHSLSLKALRILNDEMYNTQNNQMQILSNSNKFEFSKNRINQKGRKNISISEMAILSPVAMRSYRQAIKIVNAARKKYGEFDSIVVETTRDKNSGEQKKRISKSIEYFTQLNKEVDAILEDYPNIKPNSKLREKVKLYKEQEAKSAYTQQPIDLDLLVTDPTAYEVDHIIPISISLDDSINNKALVTRKENQEKGNLSPILAFEKGKFSDGTIEKFKYYISSQRQSNKISLKKYFNYLYSKDISKYENMKEFIARNLVDTSYANRLVYNTLMNYFKDNNIDTKVHTIRGSATNAFRKRIKGLEKDRDLDYSHHAIDALIVASIKKLNLYNKLLRDFTVDNNSIVIRNNTGEVIESNDDLLLDTKYLEFLSKLVDYKVTNYSYQIDTKPNRSIADQTIYSTRKIRGEDKVVKRYKDIYDKENFHIGNDIINKKYDKYLMYKNDSKTFEKLINLTEFYYEKFKVDKNSKKVTIGKKGEIVLNFNPFYEHYIENGEKITKYSKKNNGPIINSIKYIESCLGNHVDISHKYNVIDKKVILLQISPYRTDFYLDEGIYKFVTVRYSNIRYKKKEDEYFIDTEWYENQKIRKKISEKAIFCFSIHRNEYIEITDDKGIKLWRFTATNNDKTNVIELKNIDHYEKKQEMKSIGKKIKKLRKFVCTSLGELIEIKDSVLKLSFK